MKKELDFERPLRALERQIAALQRVAAAHAPGSEEAAPAEAVTGSSEPRADAAGAGMLSSGSRAAPVVPAPRGAPREHSESQAETGGAAPRLSEPRADAVDASAGSGGPAVEPRGPEAGAARRLASASQITAQIAELERRAEALGEQIFQRLSRWQIVQLARHPARPLTLDYIGLLFSDFVELRGDRCFGDDRAIVGGLARFGDRRVMVIGHQKGRSTAENVERNFGMPRPEGYRKALRLMRLADRFGLPIFTFVDTPGAYPGIEAEERGQAQAIAECLEGMASLGVPVVSVIIGEGGSGGALAIAVANVVMMLEYAVYSVISPEGCASILFKDAREAPRAADALKLTAKDLTDVGAVDRVISEAKGGAHRSAAITAQNLREALIAALDDLAGLDPIGLRAQRYARFRSLGQISSGSSA